MEKEITDKMTEKDFFPNGDRIKLNARYIGMHDEGCFLELDEEGYAFVAVPSENYELNNIDLFIYKGWLRIQNKRLIFHPSFPIDENATRVVRTVSLDNPLVRKLLNEFERSLENAA